MTSAPALPVPVCPECRTPLRQVTACGACGLPLLGPDAVRLWEVDRDLAGLEQHRHALLAERGRLLRALRSGAAAAPAQRVAAQAPVERTVEGTPRAPRQEWTPQRVQNLLLGLGALLLAVAATVFGAVTYDRLGAGGRATALLALTAVAAAAAPRLRAHGLTATAESVAAVALALAALDAWGLRRLGLGDELTTQDWLPLTAGVLAALAAGYAVATGLRLPRLGSLALAHAAGLLAVVRLEPSPVPASLLLGLLAAVHVLAVAALLRRERTAVVRDLLGAAALGAGLAGGLGALAAGAAVASGSDLAWLALVTCAAVAAGAAVAAAPCRVVTPLAALPLPLLAGAALARSAEADVAADVLPVVAAAVGLAGVGAGVLLRRQGRRGALAGAGAVLVGALAAVGEPVLAALLGPLGWPVEPWTLADGAAARASLVPGWGWTGSAAPLGVLLLAAGAAAGTGAALARRAAGAAAAGALVLVALLLTPLALDVGHAAAVSLLVALSAALVVGADLLRGRFDQARVLLLAAAAPAVLTGCWSLADRTTTLVALPLLAVLLAVVAVRPWPAVVQATATGACGAVAAAALAAAGAARGLSGDQVGGLLLVVPAVLLALSRLAGPVRRLGAQPAAGALAGLAVLLAAGDVGWLSWSLAGSGLLALLVALEPDRRVLAPVGGLLLTASSWVRLADAGVGAPEPYVVPLAALALVLGHLRFARDHETRSQAAYGAGLGLLLLPSLVTAVAGTGLARPLLLGTVALAVLLAGAAARLQAPLLFGAGTLAVLGLDLLAPYASAVPRWTALAAVGALLVVVGATFEQRRRDVAVLRERYAGLR